MIHILNMVIQLLQYHLLRLSFKNLFIINIVIVLVCVCVHVAQTCMVQSVLLLSLHVIQYMEFSV